MTSSISLLVRVWKIRHSSPGCSFSYELYEWSIFHWNRTLVYIKKRDISFDNCNKLKMRIIQRIGHIVHHHFLSLCISNYHKNWETRKKWTGVIVIWVYPCFGYPCTQISSEMGIPSKYGCRVFGIPWYPPGIPRTQMIWVPLTNSSGNFANIF